MKHNSIICRYELIPALISCLGKLQHKYRVVSKQVVRLKKIEQVSEVNEVCLDERSHEDLKELVTSSESSNFFDSLLKDSFPSIFWQQQVEAANARNMCGTHWCLYLRHR